jgi:hypothetical protein
MTTFSRILRTGMAAVVLLAGVTTFAWGFATGGGGSAFGIGRKGLTLIKGRVLCAGCSLEEMRQIQPNQYQLYQLVHDKGQLVMRVIAVNNAPTWRYFTWPPVFRVRAQDSLFQQLTTEENLLKEVEISGSFSATRALDIFAVKIGG